MSDRIEKLLNLIDTLSSHLLNLDERLRKVEQNLALGSAFNGRNFENLSISNNEALARIEDNESMISNEKENKQHIKIDSKTLCKANNVMIKFGNEEHDKNCGKSSGTLHNFYFSLKPINCYKKQIILKFEQASYEIHEYPFDGYHRIIISRNNFGYNFLSTVLKLYSSENIETAIKVESDKTLSLLKKVKNDCFPLLIVVFTQLEIKDVMHPASQSELIKAFHNKSHLGVDETFKQMSNLFFFPEMRTHIENLIGFCKICTQ